MNIQQKIILALVLELCSTISFQLWAEEIGKQLDPHFFDENNLMQNPNVKLVSPVIR